jgi:hypothetical protein
MSVCGRLKRGRALHLTTQNCLDLLQPVGMVVERVRDADELSGVPVEGPLDARHAVQEIPYSLIRRLDLREHLLQEHLSSPLLVHVTPPMPNENRPWYVLRSVRRTAPAICTMLRPPSAPRLGQTALVYATTEWNIAFSVPFLAADGWWQANH